MSASTKIKKAENQPQKTDETVEVLYQKLGDKWYAFSVIDNEVFFGSVPPDFQEPGIDKPIVK